MSTLPAEPNGVSARAANAATPAGSAYTGRSSDGISHGRLATPITASAIPAARHRGGPGPADRIALKAAAGSATRAEMVIAAKPPTAAGSRASEIGRAHV